MSTLCEDTYTFNAAVTFKGAVSFAPSTGDASLTLGDGTGGPTLNLDKDGTSDVASIILKNDSVKRCALVLEADEDFSIETFASDGTTSEGKITIATSTGVVTSTKGVTVADGTVTIQETGALALACTGLPLASTTVPLVRLGDAALVGGAAAGTFLGLNTDAATTADLEHLQNNDTTEFKVTSAGIATCAGGLTVSAGAVTVTGCTVVGLEVFPTMAITSLVATKVFGMRCPVAGTITSIASCLQVAALTTGDATITGAIAATPITDGAITITQSGSAVGDLDVVTPSAANVVAVGDYLNFTVAGTNDAATASATLTITIRRSA